MDRVVQYEPRDEIKQLLDNIAEIVEANKVLDANTIGMLVLQQRLIDSINSIINLSNVMMRN